MLMFQGRTRTKTAWQRVIGGFKLRAKFQGHQHFLLIIFAVYYILNITKVLQWQVSSFARYKTWVRFPGLQQFHIIFPLMIICRHDVLVHNAHSTSKEPRVQLLQIKGSGLRRTMGISQRVTHDPDKVTKLKINGPGLHFLIYVYSLFIFFKLQLYSICPLN